MIVNQSKLAEYANDILTTKLVGDTLSYFICLCVFSSNYKMYLVKPEMGTQTKRGF